MKRDQEYLKINDTSGEQSSLVISGDILPVNNPPSQSNKRVVKQTMKSSDKQVMNLLHLLNNKINNSNKRRKTDLLPEEQLEQTLRHLLKLREENQSAMQSETDEIQEIARNDMPASPK